MTRKHYVAFAEALRETQPVGLIHPERWEQWRRDVNAVADALGADNERFDRGRFVLACCGGRADLALAGAAA